MKTKFIFTLITGLAFCCLLAAAGPPGSQIGKADYAIEQVDDQLVEFDIQTQVVTPVIDQLVLRNYHPEGVAFVNPGETLIMVFTWYPVLNEECKIYQSDELSESIPSGYIRLPSKVPLCSMIHIFKDRIPHQT